MSTLTTKMFMVAVDGIDPLHLAFSLVKDVASTVFSGLVNAIGADEAFANPPSGVQFGSSSFYVFYQNGTSGQLMYALWDGSAWTEGNLVSGVEMSESPGAVVFNNTLYVFYQGSNNDGTLWYITSTDGSTWTAPKQVPGASLSDSPSGVVFKNNELYVFYRQANSYTLMQSSSTDGNGWNGPTSVAPSIVGMLCSPSAVVYNNLLYVFYQASIDGNFIYYT